jgi:hypothetical protein
MLENVPGTSATDSALITQTLGTATPIAIDAVEVSWAARLRLFWMTWTPELTGMEHWEPSKRGL